MNNEVALGIIAPSAMAGEGLHWDPLGFGMRIEASRGESIQPKLDLSRQRSEQPHLAQSFQFRGVLTEGQGHEQ